MRRPLIALVAVLAVVATGLVAAYAYYFTGLHTTPRPLALSSPAASPAGAAGTPATATDLAGRWTVAQGSEAGYRVKEQFAGQTSSHEAVARTSSVSGGLTVLQGSSGLVAQGISFTAQLAGLQSVDQVAGFNVSQRDRIVSRQLDVQQYPDAVFQAQSAAVPAAVATGGTVSLTVPGQLTIHGHHPERGRQRPGPAERRHAAARGLHPGDHDRLRRPAAPGAHHRGRPPGHDRVPAGAVAGVVTARTSAARSAPVQYSIRLAQVVVA